MFKCFAPNSKICKHRKFGIPPFKRRERAHFFLSGTALRRNTSWTFFFCLMRVSRQTGNGPRPTCPSPQGMSDLCVQRADWTNDLSFIFFRLQRVVLRCVLCLTGVLCVSMCIRVLTLRVRGRVRRFVFSCSSHRHGTVPFGGKSETLGGGLRDADFDVSASPDTRNKKMDALTESALGRLFSSKDISTKDNSTKDSSTEDSSIKAVLPTCEIENKGGSGAELSVLSLAAEELRSDESFVLEAVHFDCEALHVVPESLRCKEDFVLQVFECEFRLC